MKILMATMGLDIGGAETHIVELAKALKRCGHDVMIASNGGVYVEECEKAGVAHFEVPMNRRSLHLMVKSYLQLKRIIKKEKPDVVHAHARIPAFICGFIKKTVKFPFVTTAHWVFDTGGALGKLTNWGDKTIAVSDDIRDYLIENYGMNYEDISITINGIDPEKFSSDIDGSKVRKELSIPSNAPVISYVSRMDEDRALVAQHLIEIALELDKKIPGITMIITGGGNVFDKTKSLADKANANLNRNCIVMTGARTDINEIIAAGDIFVGVSRAALEAMAASKPVILAGNEGYLGIFAQDKLQAGIDGNFCCRGQAMTQGETLLNDIITLFNMSEQDLAGLGAYSRCVIMEHYSVSRMAEDALAAYHSAMPAKRFALSGYYGFGNAGDEAILESVCKTIKSQDSRNVITVLSKNPEYTMRSYPCKAVNRFNPFSVLKALRGCDILVSGGGSLLQDATSTRSLLYYITIIKIALRYGKKVMLYANGIGPVTNTANRRRVKEVCEMADIVCLRDPDSLSQLKSMGVKRDDLSITADPVFLLDADDRDKSAALLKKANVPEGKFICISIRKCAGSADLDDRIAAACDEVYEKFSRNIVFIPMQPIVDAEASRGVMRKMKSPSYILPDGCNAHQMMGVIALSDATLSMRLHSLIFAARVAVPTIGIVYDPKVESYLSLLGLGSAGTVQTFSAESAIAAFSNIFQNHDSCVSSLAEKRDELILSAKENEKLLKKLSAGE